MLVYLVWKTCILTNEETGRLFGMTYSAIIHILSSMRTGMKKDSDLRVKEAIKIVKEVRSERKSKKT